MSCLLKCFAWYHYRYVINSKPAYWTVFFRKSISRLKHHYIVPRDHFGLGPMDEGGKLYTRFGIPISTDESKLYGGIDAKINEYLHWFDSSWPRSFKCKFLFIFHLIHDVWLYYSDPGVNMLDGQVRKSKWEGFPRQDTSVVS